MTVTIEAYITKREYAYYPGQRITDHPDEAEWLSNGWAKPLFAQPANPAEAIPESTEPKPTRKAKWRKSQ